MVVLGMHRSGTSAMAGALAASGFQPPLTQMPARPENPSGYWESPVVADLNDEILAAQDASWDDLFPVDEASLLSNFGVFFLGKATDVLKAEFGEAPRIVLKDPRICLLTNVWKRTLSNQGYRIHFVLVIRHPGEVAASLARRNEFSRDKSLLLWMSSLISAERKTRGDSRSFVLYEDLLADPQAILDRIETDFGQALPRRTRVAEIEVERIVDASLRSHAHGDRATRRGELNRLAHQAYNGFRTAAQGGQLDQGMLDGVARRLAEIEELAGGVVSELRLHAHQLNARIQHAGSEAQAVTGKVEGLQHELESERTSAAALHARVSELTHAAEDAAKVLEQQHQAARAEAEALARDLAAEREAGETLGGDLNRARAEVAAHVERHQQLQQAHDALLQDVAVGQALGQAAQVRATDFERVLTEMRHAQALQEDVHRAEVDALTRDVAAGRTAQTRAANLEDLLAQTREAQDREQQGHSAEVADLMRQLAAEQATARAALGRADELDALVVEARGSFGRQQAAADDEIRRLEALVEAERGSGRAAADRASGLAADLGEAERRRSELADQNAALRSTLTQAQAEASQAVSILERRLREREAHMASDRDAFQAALEIERDEGAKARTRLEETIAELGKIRDGHAETLDQLAGDLEAERSAVRLMVGDLVRVTSELEAARRQAANLLAHKDDAAGLKAALSAERVQAAARLDKELNHSGALAGELASVKEMLAYINTRWWWRVLAWAKALLR